MEKKIKVEISNISEKYMQKGKEKGEKIKIAQKEIIKTIGKTKQQTNTTIETKNAIIEIIKESQGKEKVPFRIFKNIDEKLKLVLKQSNIIGIKNNKEDIITTVANNTKVKKLVEQRINQTISFIENSQEKNKIEITPF